jgi:hypothetical protein
LFTQTEISKNSRPTKIFKDGTRSLFLILYRGIKMGELEYKIKLTKDILEI